MAHVPGAGELAVFCGAMGGAGIGFLWFNTHPAQVFMGDVGALALGGAIGFMALADQERARPAIIGGLFVAEAVSDIIQVAYYKTTWEARLPDGADPPPFRELAWPEPRLSCVFGWCRSPARLQASSPTLEVR